MSLPNPLLPGFHPDPSVVRVGDMYDHAWAPTLRHHDGRFHHVDGVETVLAALDGRYLSAEVTESFTGRVVGMFARDGVVALDWFDYEGTDA